MNKPTKALILVRSAGDDEVSRAYKHYMINRDKYKEQKPSRKAASFRAWVRGTVKIKR